MKSFFGKSDIVPLNVCGLSYSQNQSSVYALILGEMGGSMRIPVVIGAAEAQSIAICLENIATPRPLTHDLMIGVNKAFGIELKNIFIYKFEDGVFYCEMTFADKNREIKIDARTSDAVAIALRLHAPILTTRQILDETGFYVDEDEAPNAESSNPAPKPAKPEPPRLEDLTLEELEKMLAKHIELEEYEEAAKVSEIIRRKKEDNNK